MGFMTGLGGDTFVLRLVFAEEVRGTLGTLFSLATGLTASRLAMKMRGVAGAGNEVRSSDELSADKTGAS
jgi:hypothetical protein